MGLAFQAGVCADIQRPAPCRQAASSLSSAAVTGPEVITGARYEASVRMPSGPVVK
jgi:hypothetical protein